MKRILLTLILAASIAGVSAQNCDDLLENINFGTTFGEASLFLSKQAGKFKSVYGMPEVLTTFTNPYDETQKLEVTAAYFVSNKSKVLIELHFVNGALFEKAVFHYYDISELNSAVEAYDAYNACCVEDPKLKDPLKSDQQVDETTQTNGKRTIYNAILRGKKALVGETGYTTVGNDEDGGAWAYVRYFSSLDNGLDSGMDIPYIVAPTATWEDTISQFETTEE